MFKYVILAKFTEKGIGAIQQSPDRMEAFRAAAQKLGCKLDLFLWTMGPHDCVAMVSAPDDQAMSALMLGLGRLGNVTTTTMRAFETGEFKQVLAKLG